MCFGTLPELEFSKEELLWCHKGPVWPNGHTVNLIKTRPQTLPPWVQVEAGPGNGWTEAQINCQQDSCLLPSSYYRKNCCGRLPTVCLNRKHSDVILNVPVQYFVQGLPPQSARRQYDFHKITEKTPHLVNLPVNRNITKLTPLLWKSIPFQDSWANLNFIIFTVLMCQVDVYIV